jgi:hypothetical protein
MNNNSQENLDEGIKEILGYLPYTAKMALGKEKTRKIGSAVGGIGKGISSTGRKIADIISNLSGKAESGLKTAQSYISRDPGKDYDAITGEEHVYGPGPFPGARHAWQPDATEDQMRTHQMLMARKALESHKNNGRPANEFERMVHYAFVLTPRRRLEDQELEAHFHGSKESKKALEEFREAQKGKKTKLTADQIKQKEVDVLNKSYKKAMADFRKRTATSYSSMILGDVAGQIAEFSKAEKESRSSSDRPDVSARGHARMIHADPIVYSQNFTPHHGGHGGITSHPTVVAYRDFYKEQDNSELIHPDELFGGHTYHVHGDYASLLPKDLQKANKANTAAFAAAEEAAKKAMDNPMPKLSKASFPLKMVESKEYDALKGRTKDIYGMRYGGFPRQLNG